MPSIMERDLPSPPRYAIILKTHVWDDFVQRQLDRYKAASRSGDVFVCVDDTSKPIGPIQYDRVVRFTNQKLIDMGLANRSEQGSLIWWNTDYPHYFFLNEFPDYDYYLFCEYDTVVNTDIDTLISEVARRAVDFVALPTRQEKMAWMWTRHHLRTYPIETLERSLNCISIFSSKALQCLSQRRLEMSALSAKGEVPFWPMNEVFIATEIARANLKFASLEDFGDVSRYEWYPPVLEDDLDDHKHLTFLHPVLDQKRFMGSLLKFSSIPAFFYNKSRLRRALKRFPQFKNSVPKAFVKRVIMRTQERASGMLVRTGYMFR